MPSIGASPIGKGDINLNVSVTASNVKKTQKDLEGIGNAASQSSGGFNKLAKAAKSAILPVAGVVASIAGSVLLNKLIDTGKAFEKLRIQLETAEGSASKAEVAFKKIVKFAVKTPFEVQNLTQSFVLLRNLGFSPTEAVLTRLGDVAGAFGRDILDLTEVFTTAAFGQFRVLKRLGIIAKVEGENVELLFKGIKTTVKNDSQEIFDALLKIGGAFEGGMSRAAGTYEQRLSNLSDTFGELADRFSNKSGLLKTLAEMTLRFDQGLQALGPFAEMMGGAFSNSIKLLAKNFQNLTIAVGALTVAIGLNAAKMVLVRNYVALAQVLKLVTTGFGAARTAQVAFAASTALLAKVFTRTNVIVAGIAIALGFFVKALNDLRIKAKETKKELEEMAERADRLAVVLEAFRKMDEEGYSFQEAFAEAATEAEKAAEKVDELAMRIRDLDVEGGDRHTKELVKLLKDQQIIREKILAITKEQEEATKAIAAAEKRVALDLLSIEYGGGRGAANEVVSLRQEAVLLGIDANNLAREELRLREAIVRAEKERNKERMRISAMDAASQALFAQEDRASFATEASKKFAEQTEEAVRQTRALIAAHKESAEAVAEVTRENEARNMVLGAGMTIQEAVKTGAMARARALVAETAALKAVEEAEKNLGDNRLESLVQLREENMALEKVLKLLQDNAKSLDDVALAEFLLAQQRAAGGALTAKQIQGLTAEWLLRRNLVEQIKLEREERAALKQIKESGSAEESLEGMKQLAEVFEEKFGKIPETLRENILKLEGLTSATGKYSATTATTLNKAEEAWKSFSRSIQSSFANAIEGMLGGEMTSFKDFFKGILGLFKRMVAEMVAYAATQKILLKMEVGSSAASSAADGASNIGGFRDMFKKFYSDGKLTKIGKGTLGAIGGFLVGEALGSKDSMAGELGAVGGGLGAMLGAAGALGGPLGWAIGTAIGVLIGSAIKTAAPEAVLGFKAEAGKLASTVQFNRKTSMELLDAFTDPLLKGFNEIVRGLGGTLEGLGADIEVRIRKNKFFDVIINDVATKFGEDADAAMQFAILEAIKRADISGISDTMRAVLASTSAETFEQLEKDIGVAKAIDSLVSGEARARVAQAFHELKLLIEEALRLGIDAATIAQAETAALNQMREDILGLGGEGFADRLMTALDFNEELKGLIDTYEQRRRELEAEISRIEAAMNRQGRENTGFNFSTDDIQPGDRGVEGGEFLHGYRRELDLLNESFQAGAIDLVDFARELIMSFGGLGDAALEVMRIRTEAEDLVSVVDKMFEDGLIAWAQLLRLHEQIADAEARRLKQLEVNALGGLVDIMKRAGLDQEKIAQTEARMAQLQFQLDIELVRAQLKAVGLMDKWTRGLLRQAEEFSKHIENFRDVMEDVTAGPLQRFVNMMARVPSLAKEAAEIQARMDQASFQVELAKLNMELKLLGLMTQAFQDMIDVAREWAKDWQNFLPDIGGTQDVRVVEDLTAEEDAKDEKKRLKLLRDEMEEDLRFLKDELLHALGPYTSAALSTFRRIEERRKDAKEIGGFGRASIKKLFGQIAALEIENLLDGLADSIMGLTTAGRARLEIQNTLDAVNDLGAALAMVQTETGDLSALFESWNLSQSEIDALVARMDDLGMTAGQMATQLAEAIETMRAEMEIGLVDSLLGFFSGMDIYEDEMKEIAKAQKLIQLDAIREQMEALGVFDQYRDLWDHAVDLVESGFLESLERMNELESAIQAIEEHRFEASLQSPDLANTQQLFIMRGEFNRLMQQAMGGDTSVIGDLLGARQDLLGLLGSVSQGMASSIFAQTDAQLRLLQQMFGEEYDAIANSDLMQEQIDLSQQIADLLAIVRDNLDQSSEVQAEVLNLLKGVADEQLEALEGMEEDIEAIREHVEESVIIRSAVGALS